MQYEPAMTWPCWCRMEYTAPEPGKWRHVNTIRSECCPRHAHGTAQYEARVIASEHPCTATMLTQLTHACNKVRLYWEGLAPDSRRGATTIIRARMQTCVEAGALNTVREIVGPRLDGPDTLYRFLAGDPALTLTTLLALGKETTA